MKELGKITLCLLLGLLLLTHPALAQEKDRQECQDHPLFTRMSNYYIRDCKEKDFDSFMFEELKNGKWAKVAVEGRAKNRRVELVEQ